MSFFSIQKFNKMLSCGSFSADGGTSFILGDTGASVKVTEVNLSEFWGVGGVTLASVYLDWHVSGVISSSQSCDDHKNHHSGYRHIVLESTKLNTKLTFSTSGI